MASFATSMKEYGKGVLKELLFGEDKAGTNEKKTVGELDEKQLEKANASLDMQLSKLTSRFSELEKKKLEIFNLGVNTPGKIAKKVAASQLRIFDREIIHTESMVDYVLKNKTVVSTFILIKQRQSLLSKTLGEVLGNVDISQISDMIEEAIADGKVNDAKLDEIMKTFGIYLEDISPSTNDEDDEYIRMMEEAEALKKAGKAFDTNKLVSENIFTEAEA